MSNDRLIYLLTQKKSGGITLDEQLELSDFLKEDEDIAVVIKSIDELFDSSLQYSKSVSKEDINKALLLLHERMYDTVAEVPVTTKSKYGQMKYWLVAASLILMLGAGIFYLQRTEDPLKSNNVITTQKGSKTDLVLPDGTKVWVNADTRLSYNKNFGNKTREVVLTGEAFFDVTKDKDRPFIVHTAAMDVKVLGTAFNVRAYKNEANEQATLIRGLVEVVLKNKENEKIVLAPNEKLIITNKITMSLKTKPTVMQAETPLIKKSTTKKDSLTNEIQWMQNRIVFDQERLETIIPVLERWYNVKIEQHITNSQRLYSGIFENDSIDDVLEALKIAGGFRYTIQKEKIIIY